MRSIFEFQHIYAFAEPVDFRKRRRGLAQIVQDCFGKEVFSGSLFLFRNRSRSDVQFHSHLSDSILDGWDS